MVSLRRRLVAEFVGCLFLAAAVVGSGIAAQTLSPGDVGLQLTENALATALALFVLIAVLAPISGAHFNPIISMVAAHEDAEACVCDLTEPLDLQQSTVSHHLKILVDAGYLTRSKRGTWAYYKLVPGALDGVAALLTTV